MANYICMYENLEAGESIHKNPQSGPVNGHYLYLNTYNTPAVGEKCSGTFSQSRLSAT